MQEPARRPAEPETTVRPDEVLQFQLAVVANRVSQAIVRLIETGFSLHIPEWRVLANLVRRSP